MNLRSQTRTVPILALGLLIGCQPAPAPTSTHGHRVIMHVASNGQPVRPEASAAPDQIERALGSDRAAANLQAIGGALLDYYARHGALPSSLEELKSLPDLDQPLELNSPASGQPYVYVPAGLRSPTDTREMLVFDPNADAAGLRYVILFQPPRGRDAGTTLVSRMPEAEFQQFVR